MSYNKNELEKMALKAIRENNLMFITEVAAYLPCSRPTLYNQGINELESVTDALEENRVKVKNGLRAKWYESNNATVQIALYKLIGTLEEAQRLNGSKQEVDHTTNGKSIGKMPDWFEEKPEPITMADVYAATMIRKKEEEERKREKALTS